MQSNLKGKSSTTAKGLQSGKGGDQNAIPDRSRVLNSEEEEDQQSEDNNSSTTSTPTASNRSFGGFLSQTEGEEEPGRVSDTEGNTWMQEIKI